MKNKYLTLSKKYRKMNHPTLSVVLVFALLTGLLGYVYTQASSAATTRVTNTNVATYNLRSQRWDSEKTTYAPWKERLPHVKAIITKEQPGVVGMQEVIKRNPDTNSYVSQRNDVIAFMKPMGYGYTVGSVNNSSPIFWKNDNFKKLKSGEHLIFDAASVKGAQSANKRASRYLTFARLQQKHHKKNMIVINYHFNQFEQTDSQLAKLASTVSGLRRQYPADKIIFTGDFNNKHSDVLSRLNTSGVSLKISDGHTGIDHVLVSPAVSTRSWASSGIGSPAASDHPMITSRLSL